MLNTCCGGIRIVYMDNKRTDISICALIGLTFLWTGCAYLSWFYQLAGFYAAVNVDMLTEVFGYLFQAAGLLAYALYEKRNMGRLRNRRSFALISLTALVLSALAAMSPSGAVCLVFGYGMNAVFGILAGYYLSLLAEFSSAEHTGIVFGAGYGLGSILSYLISLIGGGNFLADPRAFIVYALLWAAGVPLSARIAAGSADPDTDGAFVSGTGLQPAAAAAGSAGPAAVYRENRPGDTAAGNAASPDAGTMLNYVWIPGIALLLLSCVKSGGFYFPAADLGDHNVSLELSRSFYAAGLIAAGLINDRRRSAGAVLCVAALVFPFFTIVAGANSGLSYALWIIGYIFFGFYAVYRVLLFIDISRSDARLSYLACMGLMWGRLGDAAGAACGITLAGRPMVLITVMAALFVGCIFLFFQVFQTMYMQPAKAEPDYVFQFASRCGLSQRETELLRLVIAGKTNKEIAESLYISENTVKFHVRNLFRKTGCTKRKELIALFDSFRNSF